MSNSIDSIVKCTIEISQPVSNDQTFDSVLIITPKPASPAVSLPTNPVKISTLDDLTTYGYTESEAVYKAISLMLAQSPAPSTVYIYMLKVAEGETETHTTALNFAATTTNFYGIYTVSDEMTDIAACSAWAETHEKLYACEITGSKASITSSITSIKDNLRTILVYGSAGTALALMGKCFGYQPGSETWAFKTLSKVSTFSGDTTEIDGLLEMNLILYLTVGGVNLTMGGKVLGGEWIDVIRFRDWVKSNVQFNVFKVLKENRKVEYTDNGIGMIEGAVDAALKEGQEAGGIVQTTYDENGVAVPGYTVIAPKASDISEADKQSRTLKGIKWSARLSGAIHAVEINGYLSF